MKIADFALNFGKTFKSLLGTDTPWHRGDVNEEYTFCATELQTECGCMYMTLNFDMARGVFWCDCIPSIENFDGKGCIAAFPYVNEINSKCRGAVIAVLESAEDDEWELHLMSGEMQINFAIADMPNAGFNVLYALQMQAALKFFHEIIDDKFSLAEELQEIEDCR